MDKGTYKEKHKQVCSKGKKKWTTVHSHNNGFCYTCCVWSGSLASMCGVTVGTINEQRRDAKIRLSRKAWLKLRMFTNIIKTEISSIFHWRIWNWFTALGVILNLDEYLMNRKSLSSSEYVDNILCLCFSHRTKEIELY